MKTFPGLLICVVAAFSPLQAQPNPKPAPLSLWYDQPAKEWMTQALPIGNGHVGAMFFGGTDEERLQFSEGSLWAGGKGANADYNFGLKKEAYKHLPQVRELLAAGKMEEAHALANRELTGVIHEKKEIPFFRFRCAANDGRHFYKNAIQRCRAELPPRAEYLRRIG
jgi:alpha-L-fucosidase 2